MTRQRKNQVDMVHGPIFRRIMVFTVPLMLSSILQLLFNAADIIVVGHFAGDDSLAAVGSTASIVNLLVNLFVGISIGVNVLAARCYGAKDVRGLSRTTHTAMLISVLSGLFLALVGVFFARPILTAMDSPVEVIDKATAYLRLIFLGMPVLMIYNFGAALLRAVGDTRRPLIYLAIAGVVNVLLNLVFVIVLRMDAAGVGLATTLSQCLSAVLIWRCLAKEHGGLKLRVRLLRIHKRQLLAILRVGLPAGVQGILFSIANVTIQASINSFGHVTMAGNAAASNIEGFVYVAMNSFYQAAISFTSQNVGACRYDRIHLIMVRSMTCVTVTGLVLGVGAWLLGRPLLGIYSQSAPVIEAGLIRLSVVSATYALCGMMDTMVGMLRGLGYSLMPMIVSLLGACVFRLIWLATVFQIPSWHTVQTVYLSYSVSWAITLTAHVVCYTVIYHKRVRPRLRGSGCAQG